MSADNRSELRDKLESLVTVHKQANWDKNLGQYKSEHKCECGFTFIVDGHSDYEIGARGRMNAHVADMLLELFATEMLAVAPEKKSGDDVWLKNIKSFAYENGYNAAIDDITQIIERYRGNHG